MVSPLAVPVLLEIGRESIYGEADDALLAEALALGEVLAALPPLAVEATLDGLLPVFARDIWNVGPVGLGWLAGGGAVGAVLGGMVIGSIPSARWPVVIMLSAYFFEGLANGAFGIGPSLSMRLRTVSRQTASFGIL